MVAYKDFIELYPSLTSGGAFNSFSGLNVVEVYEKTVAALVGTGYAGVYVIYDEFSKYLETNIADASVNEIKLLQDFAEKCNRSANNQMHLLLICHKDISNYIDGKLPKEKVDGWRGVSGRFEHIEIRNGFAQSYELIESSIVKDETLWTRFLKKNSRALNLLEEASVLSNLADSASVSVLVKGCYPLHPVTTFLLPRISEKVAQNERTLFTYLTSAEKNALHEAYSMLKEEALSFITPDNLFDYFEPLFRRESYTSEVHSLFELTSRILARFENESLESKIIKTLMLIYVVAQFESLAPTKNQIVTAFTSTESSVDAIERAIDVLIREDAVVYLRRSNGYLKLKESSGVNIEEEISRVIERNKSEFTTSKILDEITTGKAIFPSRHNTENEIVRFFQCGYLSSDDYWKLEENSYRYKGHEDGHLLAVLPKNIEDLEEIKASIERVSAQHSNTVFIIPKKYKEIEDVVLHYKAALILKDEVKEDSLLADEYEVFLEDYSEVIASFGSAYFQPELKAALYYHNGKKAKVFRKAQLSELLSCICDSVYPNTPVINNEAINKHDLSTAAIHSRTKVLSGLCSPILEPNLGLQGNGQECSIMRSVFAVTGIISNLETSPAVDLRPADSKMLLVFDTIRDFFYSGDGNDSFSVLYDLLTTDKRGIGLKRGLVVLFLATVLREDWNNLLLLKGSDEQRLTAGILNDLDCNPGQFYVKPIEWTPEKAEFVDGVKALFVDYLSSAQSRGDFTQAVDAISRWYLSLPRFTKTATRIYGGSFHTESYANMPQEYLSFFKALKRTDINPREFLFEGLPKIFKTEKPDKGLLKYVSEAKEYLDNYVTQTSQTISDDLRLFFDPSAHPDASLASIIHEWSDNLSEDLREQVFAGSTNRILSAITAFTSDEENSLRRLYKSVTSLRIEDWDERTIQVFISEMGRFKDVIERFAADSSSDTTHTALRISFKGQSGDIETKSFQHVSLTPRAKLLKNEIETAIEEMGQSIDDSEKRQVLFDVLREICQ